MRDAYVVAAVRTAVGKAKKGTLKDYRPDDMAATVIKGALEKVEGLKPEQVDDVILGCAMPEGEQGMNVGRISALAAGMPDSVPAMTVNRFCSSGLETVSIGIQKIMCGWADVVLAGGTETMSLIPMGGKGVSPNPFLAENHPETYLGMGLTAERLVEKYDISREEQDEFAYHSHRKAIKAIDDGLFEEEIIPLEVPVTHFGKRGRPYQEKVIFKVDEGPRRDTSVEGLAKLKPAFKMGGTVTAGNSSQMSDGAAILVLMSGEKVKELGVKPVARLLAYTVAGVPPEIMGIGPVEAVPKVMKLTGLSIDQMDVIELNEAFAAQSISVIRELKLPEDRINVNGGAVALGHPLGCTGAKITATILQELKRRGGKYGLVTMCIGGGMGAAGIFEMI